ncbi:MAG: hypothetical protein GKR94_00445 [Gammaproteobacteria bacterium]|nr:hypothetical protein [Gammaproteobacteria bacterium]
MHGTYRVALTTSLRSGGRSGGRGEEISGSVIAGWLDPEQALFTVQRQLDLPESPHLAGRRSLRGIAPFADGVAVCNTSQLFLLDNELRAITGCFSDRRFGDIHSIASHGGELFVTATASDCVIGINACLQKTFAWWAGSDPLLAPYMREWQRSRVAADHDFRYDASPGARFHMNHVCFDGAGDMLVNLPGMTYQVGESRVYNVSRKQFEFAGHPIEAAVRGRVHDGVALGKHYFLCRTASGEFVKLKRATGAQVAAVDCSTPLRYTTGDPLSLSHGWLRGAVHLHDELFLVGQACLQLFLVDTAAGTKRAVHIHGAKGEFDDPGLAIYCIAKLPSQ